jgi:hypothetical protein
MKDLEKENARLKRRWRKRSYISRFIDVGNFLWTNDH